MFVTFKSELSKLLEQKQIIENELLRYAYSVDASHYRMLPKLVITVNNENDVCHILKLANKYDIKLTFRAAGTSLSGQAVTDQVLVVLSGQSWLTYKILDDGYKINLEPGIIGENANKYLSIYGRKIGPDPGSISTAKIGGIVSNNSSGMCCGFENNTYATVDSIRIVFADSTVLDTSDSISINNFKNKNPQFIETILSIRDDIVNDEELVSFITKKFSIKNTSGYSLNAFLDYSDPIKIIERLIIGSEGTLGFVSNITYNTIANHKHKALNLIYGDLDDLVKLTIDIKKYKPSSVELLDYESLKAVSDLPELKPFLQTINQDMSAIMVELSEDSNETLLSQIGLVSKCISNSKISSQIGFIQDKNEMQTLWKVRNGVLPLVAGQRPLGSTVLIEDVAVNISDLPSLILDLKDLFNTYNYNKAAIFGHVLSGNVHFVLTPDFSEKKNIIAYDKFMHDLTHLVAKKYNGSLKAEHGSGRNISPFAYVEWGDKIMDIMWTIKNSFDPSNILNPDVKLTKDSNLHTKNLKTSSTLDNDADKCMECGFCEPVCPSRNLSLTPRQRISVMRKINSLNTDKKEQWLKDFEYFGIDTCAKTSLCKVRCPIQIDTGEYIRSLQPVNNKIVNHAKEISLSKSKVKIANLTANIVGSKNLNKITKVMHNQFKSIPVYLENMPTVQTTKFENNHVNDSTKIKDKILLIPSCPNKIFASEGGSAIYPPKKILELLGFDVEYPLNNKDVCCGQMYHSTNNKLQLDRTLTTLKNIDFSQYKYVVIDNSSCSSFVKNLDINITNINDLVVKYIHNITLDKSYNKVALHLDCSTRKQDNYSQYISVIDSVCTETIIPEFIYCCGFAGDKGFNTPELNSSSLDTLKDQVYGCDIGVSFNRTCQIGLTNNSSIRYISFVEFVLMSIKE